MTGRPAFAGDGFTPTPDNANEHAPPPPPPPLVLGGVSDNAQMCTWVLVLPPLLVLTVLGSVSDVGCVSEMSRWSPPTSASESAM